MLSIILISCLGIIVYSHTFFYPFHFDDGIYIVNNFAIKNIQNLSNIWEICPCRFITFLSIAFNYHFHQLNVFGYHLFNLTVHLGTAILVWWFVLLTFSTPAMKAHRITQHANLIALLAGLVFVSHPIQTQAVTYIWQRATSMASLFYVASLCFYVKSRLSMVDSRFRGNDNRQRGNDKSKAVIPAKAGIQFRINAVELGWFYYICSLITAIAAMFTKETAITLPLMILLYEVSFLKTKEKIHWPSIIPFLITLIVIPLTMLLTKSARFQEIHDIVEGPGGISPMHYLLTQFRVMLTYIRLVFIPIGQNLDYDYPIFKNIFEVPVFLSFLFLISILFGAKRLFSKYRLVSFSIFWFFLTLLPESSFLPLKDVIYEHRLYLPLVGYSIFLVSGMYYLFGKNSIKMMVIVLTGIIICNSVLTYQRNKVWRDDITLWNDVIGKSPHKARPYINRGIIYSKQGHLDQAMADLNKGIAMDPNCSEAYSVRGFIYEKQGKLIRALIEFTKAVMVYPGNLIAYYKRAMIFKKMGDFSHAISDFTKIIEIAPDDAGGYTGRGIIFSEQGNFTSAISDFNKSIEIDPDFAEAHMNLGIVYVKQGNLTQAISEFNKALEINPNYIEAYNERAMAYSLLKKHGMPLLKY